MNVAVNLRQMLDNLLSVKGSVWVVGKVSLVLAVAFAHFTGLELLQARQQEVPKIETQKVEQSRSGKVQVSEAVYAGIVRSTIFGKPEASQSSSQADAKVTELKLRLVGTNVNEGKTSYAIVEDTKNGEQDVFSVNEMVFDQAKLVALFPEKILLKREGKSETETLFLEEGGGAEGATEEGVPADDQTQFSVKEEELNNELANLPRLLSQARAVPYFRNGQSVGMRLFAIRRGSLYEKLGLKNGDILKSVNDSSLSDPAQALKLFEQLKSERSIYLTVERNSEDVDLRYAIE